MGRDPALSFPGKVPVHLLEKNTGGIIPDEKDSGIHPARKGLLCNYGQTELVEFKIVSVTSAPKSMVLEPPVNKVPNGMKI